MRRMVCFWGARRAEVCWPSCRCAVGIRHSFSCWPDREHSRCGTHSKELEIHRTSFASQFIKLGRTILSAPSIWHCQYTTCRKRARLARGFSNYEVSNYGKREWNAAELCRTVRHIDWPAFKLQTDKSHQTMPTDRRSSNGVRDFGGSFCGLPEIFSFLLSKYSKLSNEESSS